MADTKVSALSEISVPALDDATYVVDAGGPTSNKITIARLLGLLKVCQGRLTTETGVPVSTTDRTSQGTIYWTQIGGGALALYDGTRWNLHIVSADLSLALTVTSGKNYDVFIYDNAGTPTLELSAAWTNDTTRADALTTQDGVLVKSGAVTRRYVGTIRASGANVTEDSVGGSTTQVGGKRFVWNYYNRVPRPMRVKDTTDNWSYTTASWRQANAASGNQVEYVVGDASVRVTARLNGTIYVINGGPAAIGIGVNSTTANSAFNGFAFNDAANEIVWHAGAAYAGTPQLGYSYLAWIEFGTGAGGSSFFGDDGGSYAQSGLEAEIMG
jgi:hypothetical protein